MTVLVAFHTSSGLRKKVVVNKINNKPWCIKQASNLISVIMLIVFCAEHMRVL